MTVNRRTTIRKEGHSRVNTGFTDRRALEDIISLRSDGREESGMVSLTGQVRQS